MGTQCVGKHLLSLFVFASHVVWRTGPRGVQDLEEGMQDNEHDFQKYGIIVVMGAQDEVKSH